MFDAQSYLQDRGIKFTSGGHKNVSHGWIGIQCPFCGDHSNHGGINLKTGFYGCWICGQRAKPIELIMALENCSFENAKKIYNDFRDDSSELVTRQNQTLPPPLTPQGSTGRIIPENFLLPLRFPQKNFLKKRGVDPKELAKKYRITRSHDASPFPGRIVVPFFLDRKIVTYVLLDWTGKSAVKYLPCKKEKAIISHKKTLYNIDNVKKGKVAIVEGFFETWKIGDGAVATMGIQFTRAQIRQLIWKEVREAYVIYDKDRDGQGQRMGKKLANQLSGIIDYVEYIELDFFGDPDELDDASLSELKALID
jgi:DNA primase